ncbi:MAG: cytochrome b N-terminal domain-containing protein, partial [Chloroflexota bacterium]
MWPNTGIDWKARQSGWVKKLLRGAERLSLALERPVGRLVGSPQFNPLYHTGTITVFLLLVVAFTGVYLTLFYPFGFEASYRAVAGVETVFLGRLMRALHRYASGALVIAALLHGWRTFFQDRFRAARWTAWLSGVGMAALVWVIGVTGYWLIWDERTQPINQVLIDMLDGSAAGQAFLVDYLVLPKDGVGSAFVLIVIGLHLGLSALTGWLLWLHLKRLNRPKWLPPNFWMALVGGLLVIAAVARPVGTLPPLDWTRLPAGLPLDAWYLAYLPPALGGSAGAWWLGLGSLLLLAALVPWLLGSWTRRPLPPVKIDPERCTGCTL